jgi:cytochrome c biogenesis protein CcdA/thiol-disulfide isomerase/thioredoxin
MTTLLIAYLGGVLTILSPCVLPVLPFVFARVDRPFRSHGLPLLLGMGIAFCATATLAAVGGGAAVAAHQFGREAALVLMAAFGLTLIMPAMAHWIARPLVSFGQRVTQAAGAGKAGAMVLGLGTGLLWAPCAGPILGLVLTAAALNGAGAGTTLLLAGFAAGACTALGAALVLGGRLLPLLTRTLIPGQRVRAVAGAAVLISTAAIALGVDAQVLSRLPVDTTFALERSLIQTITRQNGSSERAAPADAPDQGPLIALAGSSPWINSEPITAKDLRGKVVLVNFWTYSCINCLRTLPYLTAWQEKYRDAGLVVLGVHTPEFAFEKLTANVRRATVNLRVGYPVVLDNEFRIWRAFDNRAWPGFYFVDAHGRVRHHQFGENQYAEAERVLQRLLAESAAPSMSTGLVLPTGEGVQAPPGHFPAASQEAYLGRERSRGMVVDARRSLRLDEWSLDGEWRIDADHVVQSRPGARISYRFHARDLHLVIGPSADGTPVRFRVRIDGMPPGADKGSDVDAQGQGVVDVHRLYQLVRQRAGAKEALFEIEFLDTGAQAYAFTFG